MIELFLVDDDDINNFLFSHLLKKSEANASLQSFTNPLEALQAIKARIADQNAIDLLLLDINMPLLSGWEVLEELRADTESLLKNTRIYMLSSSVHATDMEQASIYPEVSGFISKPISLDQLSGIFAEIENKVAKPG